MTLTPNQSPERTNRTAPTLTKEMWIALKKAERKGFWGVVQVDYKDGKPVLVRLSEVMKSKETEDQYERTTEQDDPRY